MPSFSNMRKRYFFTVCSLNPNSVATSRLLNPSATRATTCSSREVRRGSGICVLTSDTAENREAVGDTGFTFKRGDVHDLQRMLTMLLNDDDLRQTTGRLAQERVRQHYLWDEVAKKNRRALFGIDACL